MITVAIVGLRDLKGRFAAMAEGGELVAYQTSQARVLGTEIEGAYQREAPRSKQAEEDLRGRRSRFADSFKAEVAPKPAGFELSVTTDQGDLAKWIREGTKPHEIVPKQPGGVLAFEVGGERVFTRRVHHPGTSPNPWEDKVEREIEPRVTELGNKIGRFVVTRLGGKL